MSKVAIVTGAGSGVGRAVALHLVREGWNVGLVGRRADALNETIQLAGQSSPKMVAAPSDVADPAQVAGAARLIHDKFGPPTVLVAAAGLNIPKRSWEVLTYEDFRHVIDANLTGTFNWVRELLPAMRQSGSGTIVTIVSDAALTAMPKAGPAYTASKFAQRGLTHSINAEERHHGIRATAILPGDIDTPILDKRPVPPTPEARLKMLQPDDVAACAMLAINLPTRAIVEELLVRPR
jgi:NAD(P)-dependent dehydrogenase (short-subunit alcohol dehydrogenase family)